MQIYHVKGMTCQHCVRAVTDAVQSLKNVEKVEIDLKSGTLKIEGNPDQTALKTAIEEEGFQIL